MPGSAVYFVAYEFWYRLLRKEGQAVSTPAVIFAGGMAGVAMWSVVIVKLTSKLQPPDVIKSRIQASPQGTYKGFIHCGAQS